MPAFSVEDVLKAAPGSAASIHLMSIQQQQEKQQRDYVGSSSPFISPSPYILNCKRRVHAGWNTRDALSGGGAERVGDVASKPDLFSEPLRKLGVVSSGEEASRTDIPSASVATKGSNPLHHQLSELREALESFLIDSWSLRSREEGTTQQVKSAIDVQELRTKLLREKILTEILSSRRGGSMKVRSEDTSGRHSVSIDAVVSPRPRSPSFDEDFFSPADSTIDEFYDARDASPDGCPSKGCCSLGEPELAHQLQNEVEKRMKAEEGLKVLQQCQQEIISKLLSAGCSVAGSPQPASYGASNDHGLASLIDQQDWQDDDGQRTLVARLISSAVVRGALRAEEAEALKILLTMKDRETSRLRQKLRFFEQVNQEFSRKNQEATERARRIRRSRQKWLSISGKFLLAGMVLGVSGSLLYRFLPWDKIRCVKSTSSSSSSSPSVAK